MHQDYATPEALRSFLKLCLDPGHGIKRTPVRLAEVLPEPLALKVSEFAPHVGELRQRAEDGHRAYVEALTEWIHGQDPEPQPAPVTLASQCYDCQHTLNWHSSKGRCTLGECTCDRFQAERYVIGRNGVFATLYDWQEHRLVVDNSTEDYCRRVRDGLLAAEGTECVCGAPVMWVPGTGDAYSWKHRPQPGRSCQRARPRCSECRMPHLLIPGEPPMCRSIREHVAVDEPKPTPASAAPRSMPLMEAVTIAYDAATAHATECGTCWPGMRLAEMCPDGQRAAIASLDQVPAAGDCAHDEHDEISTVDGLILRRRCRHCGEPLEAVVEPECAHLAWEVTSEYRNVRLMWVKSRKCADCGDPMPDLVEPEPHWPDKAAQHPKGR